MHAGRGMNSSFPNDTGGALFIGPGSVGGEIQLIGGSSSSAQSGNLYLASGNAKERSGTIELATGFSTNKASGQVAINTGPGKSGSGYISLETGESDGASSGGINIQSGDAQFGPAGNITLRIGASNQSTQGGSVSIFGGLNAEGNGAVGGNIFLEGGLVSNESASHAGEVIIKGGMAKHSADNGKTNGFGGKVGIQGGASNEGTGGDITVESGYGNTRSGAVNIKSQLGGKGLSSKSFEGSGHLTIASGDSYAKNNSMTGKVAILSGSVFGEGSSGKIEPKTGIRSIKLGAVEIGVGNTVNATGGNVNVVAGSSSGLLGTHGGSVQLKAGKSPFNGRVANFDLNGNGNIN